MSMSGSSLKAVGAEFGVDAETSRALKRRGRSTEQGAILELCDS